ncbi:MAG: hypothetical protein JXK93_14100 [Sphaerochaetaceae bacterium]|nr:hypothetical protein [Sphaerochaetaceae bacterium]
MKRMVFHLLCAALILIAFLSPLSAEAPDSDFEHFSQKKEMLLLYEKILAMGEHVYPIDLYTDIHWYAAEENPYASFGAGLHVRPFAAKPFQHKQVQRFYQLYEETKFQTGLSLSPQAEQRMQDIVRDARNWEQRGSWQRVVLQAGRNIPFTLPDLSYTEGHWYAAFGYELRDDGVLSVGLSLEQSPAVTISFSYTFLSDLYAGIAHAMDRTENMFTMQRIYHNEFSYESRP